MRLVLIRYIQNLHSIVESYSQINDLFSQRPDFDAMLLKAFDDETLNLLQAKGWYVSDVMSWAWILTAESSEKAATRLMMLARPPAGTSGVVIPTFVFMLLLRRTDMTAHALRLLIIHAWDRLPGRSPIKWTTKSSLELKNVAMLKSWPSRMRNSTATSSVDHHQMSETTVMTMVIRLLRHCRKLWPAACVSVGMMLTKYFDGISPENNPNLATMLPEQTVARFTFLYNKILSLLSKPSSMYPFQSVVHHQRAQFTLLRRMNEFEPALAINREGYRAVTGVQLAHRKTLSEREWADRKAESWPPWKQDRLGIDADIGPEHGVSRAGESIYRSKEAGYAPQNWERAAGILAGWDTDRSPTIQTRTRFQDRLVPRRIVTSRPSVRPEQDTIVWSARIKATRTLDEAWVCFLAYKDQGGGPSQAPYYAMFEKLVFERKRRTKEDTSGNIDLTNGSASDTSAGDGKELLPNPKDPRISIHVRTPPPSVEGFFDSMTEDKVFPSGRFLAFLLSHAESFGAGIKYLRASPLPPRIIEAMLDQDLDKNYNSRAELESMPDYLFAAFIIFLGRFAPRFSRKYTNLVNDLSVTNTSPDRFERFEISVRKPLASPINPLLHAFRLMACRRPYYRPPWNSLLSALARLGTTVDSSFTIKDPSVQDVLTWNVICDVLHQMREIGLDLDLQGFQIVCVALEKAVFASEILIQDLKKPALSRIPKTDTYQSYVRQWPDQYTRLRLDAEQVLLDGLPRVKKLFKDIVNSDIVQDKTTSSGREVLRAWPEDGGTPNISDLLPRLLEVPHPAQLHAFIRVLGLCTDYTGMLDLVQWMSRFMPELMAAASETANGSRMMRRCVIAVRVFLERCWAQGDCDSEGDVEDDEPVREGAPEELIEKVHGVVQRHKEWGDWPSDEEVEEYCSKGRFI